MVNQLIIPENSPSKMANNDDSLNPVETDKVVYSPLHDSQKIDKEGTVLVDNSHFEDLASLDKNLLQDSDKESGTYVGPFDLSLHQNDIPGRPSDFVPDMVSDELSSPVMTPSDSNQPLSVIFQQELQHVSNLMKEIDHDGFETVVSKSQQKKKKDLAKLQQRDPILTRGRGKPLIQ